MKRHNGRRKINKVDGGKKRAKRQYHKSLRENKPRPKLEVKPCSFHPGMCPTSCPGT